MIRVHGRRVGTEFGVLVAGVVLSIAQCAFAQNYAPGDLVTVITWDIEFKQDSNVGGTSELGRNYIVGRVNRKWLWIESRHAWLNRSDVVPFDEAIEHFTDIIRREPTLSTAYLNRATTWNERGEYDTAIADFNEAIRLDPTAAMAYYGRGNAWKQKGDIDQAIADYNESIRLDPTSALAYYDRGNLWLFNSDFDQAIADYNESIRLDPTSALVYNGYAWILATCCDESFRNGEIAVFYATKACELNDWMLSYDLGTLAAAYAETGQFAEAVEYQTKAIELAQAEGLDDDIEEGFESRLELYQAGMPYRQTPSDPEEASEE